jgi:hypothetical protein
MPDTTFEPLEVRGTRTLVVGIFVFIIFVDDFCVAMLATALNNGDTSHELVHAVLPSEGVKISADYSAHVPARLTSMGRHRFERSSVVGRDEP